MKLVVNNQTSPTLASPEELIEEARNGRMFILVDDEDRENEGDLIVPAQMATPETINFMAKEGRGLICLAMEAPMIDRLELPMMGQQRARMGTAFTVSIEAREGITTGISAADRAHTIQTAIAANAKPDDIVTPGHVFPLKAREGGVLVRAGHTEAAVDIARMAGLQPAGVICEVMKDDGTMARLNDLIPFAQKHNLKIGTIADLIAYRRRTEKIIDKVLETDFTSRSGASFRLHVYVNKLDGVEHVALVKGRIKPEAPTLVRVHAVNILNDLLGGAADSVLEHAVQVVGEEGGVVVLIREPGKASISETIRLKEQGQPVAIREYGIGAQILLDVGVKEMTILTNSPKSIAGLDGYGLHIVGHRPIV